MLAAEIGPTAVVAARQPRRAAGRGAVVLALRFSCFEGRHRRDRRLASPTSSSSFRATRSRRTHEGNVLRVLPEGQSSGKVVAGWLPAGARLAMAFGTMSADLLESSSNRSPEPAVLFYATDDDRAGEEIERLIRAAGFEPIKVGGTEQSDRLEVGGDLHDLVVGPSQRRGRSRVEPDRPSAGRLRWHVPMRAPVCEGPENGANSRGFAMRVYTGLGLVAPL